MGRKRHNSRGGGRRLERHSGIRVTSVEASHSARARVSDQDTANRYGSETARYQTSTYGGLDIARSATQSTTGSQQPVRLYGSVLPPPPQAVPGAASQSQAANWSRPPPPHDRAQINHGQQSQAGDEKSLVTAGRADWRHTSHPNGGPPSRQRWGPSFDTKPASAQAQSFHRDAPGMRHGMQGTHASSQESGRRDAASSCSSSSPYGRLHGITPASIAAHGSSGSGTAQSDGIVRPGNTLGEIGTQQQQRATYGTRIADMIPGSGLSGSGSRSSNPTRPPPPPPPMQMQMQNGNSSGGRGADRLDRDWRYPSNKDSASRPTSTLSVEVETTGLSRRFASGGSDRPPPDLARSMSASTAQTERSTTGGYVQLGPPRVSKQLSDPTHARRSDSAGHEHGHGHGLGHGLVEDGGWQRHGSSTRERVDVGMRMGDRPSPSRQRHEQGRGYRHAQGYTQGHGQGHELGLGQRHEQVHEEPPTSSQWPHSVHAGDAVQESTRSSQWPHSVHAGDAVQESIRSSVANPSASASTSAIRGNGTDESTGPAIDRRVEMTRSVSSSSQSGGGGRRRGGNGGLTVEIAPGADVGQWQEAPGRGQHIRPFGSPLPSGLRVQGTERVSLQAAAHLHAALAAFRMSVAQASISKGKREAIEAGLREMVSQRRTLEKESFGPGLSAAKGRMGNGQGAMMM